MKSIKKLWLMASLLLSLPLLLCSCDNEDDDVVPDMETKYQNIALTGAAEVQTPAVVSTGSGTLYATYNHTTKKIAYTINWKLDKQTDQTVGMHFHGPASITENGAIIIGIPLTGNSSGGYNDPGSDAEGTVSGQTRALTQEEENQLLSGRWYLNIHSTTYPAGELRGQVK